MKNQITKKLSAFIVTAMMFSASANAQILYTDVNPDSTVQKSGFGILYYHLDLNNDGINDFYLSANTNRVSTYNYQSSVSILPRTGGEAVSNAPALNSNDRIDAQSGWSSSSALLRKLIGYPNHYTGSWVDTSDHYLGLRFSLNGNEYYGWARLSSVRVLVNRAAFTIKNYAFNSIPNQPILAGETSCAIPTVNLTASGALSFCNGDSVTFTANGTGYQYQWKKNNINIAGATAKKYVAKTAGVYKCIVSNSCGSRTSGGITVAVPCRNSNENTVETLEHISVYPNPATNSVTIEFPSEEEGTIQIVNLFGQIVFSEKVNSEQVTIDVSKFLAGMYMVRWSVRTPSESSGDNNETKTFLIMK